MKPGLENVLVNCLQGTLNIMIYSDSPLFMRSSERMLSGYTIYNLFKAKSTDEFDFLFRQVNSWHAFIVDEQCQSLDECLQRVNENSRWIPVILLVEPFSSNSSSVASEKARKKNNIDSDGIEMYECKVAASCPINKRQSFLQTLQMLSIERKLFSDKPNGLIQNAVEVLFNSNPYCVGSWASVLHSTQRKFQRQLKQFTSLSPKKLLALYHAYRIAFEILSEQDDHKKGVIPAYVIDEQSKTRIMEYVLMRRSSLLVSSSC